MARPTTSGPHLSFVSGDPGKDVNLLVAGKSHRVPTLTLRDVPVAFTARVRVAAGCIVVGNCDINLTLACAVANGEGGLSGIAANCNCYNQNRNNDCMFHYAISNKCTEM